MLGTAPTVPVSLLTDLDASLTCPNLPEAWGRFGMEDTRIAFRYNLRFVAALQTRIQLS